LATAQFFKKINIHLGIDEFSDFVIQDWTRSYLYIFIYLFGVISINYYFDLEDSYLDLYKNSWKGIFFFYLLNLCVYVFPLLILAKDKSIAPAIKSYVFWAFLLLSLFCLSAYQGLNPAKLFYEDWYNANYFNFKVGSRLSSLSKYLILFVFLGLLIGKGKDKLFGFLNFKINYKTYIGFLMVMLPFILFASTQQDFLDTYPKLKQVNVSFNVYLDQLFLFEPLYLLDFVMLEWFFRGFMVLFFARYLNQKSVILVALVYCSFHFGKPLLECVSSFFGGYLLGYVVYKTKSIWGGVIVHMGIAFMMDLFAFMSKAYL
jgi:hypothetical protein